MSLNTDLSDLFARMAAILEIKGENAFKAISFAKGGRLLRDWTVDGRDCIEKETLCDIEGIGPSSQKIIEEYAKSGRSTDYDELAANVPSGLLPMLAISGLG